jgi:hypothetical protein
MLAIDTMGTTWRFIFYTIAIVAFIASAVGIKFGGERAALIGFGLFAAFFPVFWDNMALL